MFEDAQSLYVGSGCCSVGRAVASNTRDSQFESRHWKILLSVKKRDYEAKKLTERVGESGVKILTINFPACTKSTVKEIMEKLNF